MNQRADVGHFNNARDSLGKLKSLSVPLGRSSSNAVSFQAAGIAQGGKIAVESEKQCSNPVPATKFIKYIKTLRAALRALFCVGNS
ncbi:MAG: hypothetical protein ACK4GC_11665, partial [Paracoccaceae bacterium]